MQITASAALLDALDPHRDSWLTALLTAYRRSRDAPPDEHPATTSRDSDRRLPGAALARWIDARDPVCVAPGCHVLARRCEHDHTRDWQDGGRTRADGLANLCKADHRAKHARGWTHEQPTRGRFTITDPTGTVHHTESRMVRPLPDPMPAHHPHGRPEHVSSTAGGTLEYLHATRPARQATAPAAQDEDPPF